MKTHVKFLSLSFVFVFFAACNTTSFTKKSNGDGNENASEKVKSVEFKEHALLSNGQIEVGTKLYIDGPLANVHSNAEVFAEPKSIKTHGLITSSAVKQINSRSGKRTLSTKRVNKVLLTHSGSNSFIIDNSILNGYELSKDGRAYEYTDGEKLEIDLGLVPGNWEKTDSGWMVSGDPVFEKLLYTDGALEIRCRKFETDSPVIVSGNLSVEGLFSIHSDAPFETSLYVDGSVQLKGETDIFGKVEVGGDLLAYEKINIEGNIEVSGMVDFRKDANINYIDLIYKNATIIAQEKFDKAMLVHSQIFKDPGGKNTVALFTYTDDYKLMDEATIYHLLESGEYGQYKFYSFIIGASGNWDTVLVEYDKLAPYYFNKYKLLKRFHEEGHGSVVVGKALDLPTYNLFHAFYDEDNNTDLGTYQVESIYNANENLAELPDENLSKLSTAVTEQNSAYETLLDQAMAVIEAKQSGGEWESYKASLREKYIEDNREIVDSVGELNDDIESFLNNNPDITPEKFQAYLESNKDNAAVGLIVPLEDNGTEENATVALTEEERIEKIIAGYITRKENWTQQQQYEVADETEIAPDPAESNVTTAEGKSTQWFRSRNSYSSRRSFSRSYNYPKYSYKTYKKTARAVSYTTSTRVLPGVSTLDNTINTWEHRYAILNHEGPNCTPISAAMATRYMIDRNNMNGGGIYEQLDDNERSNPVREDVPIVRDLIKLMKTDSIRGTYSRNVAGGLTKYLAINDYVASVMNVNNNRYFYGQKKGLIRGAIDDGRVPVVCAPADDMKVLQDGYDSALGHCMPVLGYTMRQNNANAKDVQVRRIYVHTTWPESGQTYGISDSGSTNAPPVIQTDDWMFSDKAWISLTSSITSDFEKTNWQLFDISIYRHKPGYMTDTYKQRVKDAYGL